MDRLETYRQKRDFDRTPEPAGGKTPRVGGQAYVMQKHAASHDHFDLRLEQDGVLRSWALPKGASLKPGEKHLAVQTEDHPLEYGNFEGVIPDKEYGGGTVMLWDRGHWRADPKGKIRDGHLDVILEGEKLRGRWTLTRMGGKAGGKDGRNWLLIKRSDGGKRAHRKPHDRSVISDRTLAAIAKDGDRVWKADDDAPAREAMPAPKDLAGARTDTGPEVPSPQLATLADAFPKGDWFHEIKFDGYRVVADLDHGRVRLWTRNGKDWTHRFPELVDHLAALDLGRAILDGEVVALTPDGLSSFRHLQEALSEGRTGALVYQVFDLLHLDGQDLTGVGNLDRKEALGRALDAAGVTPTGPVRYTDHLTGQGPALLDRLCQMGLEGVICKRTDGRYRPGARSKDWLKVKCARHDEFVIGGYTEPGGSRTGFGSLLLGGFDDRGRFHYAGRVGTGFSAVQLDDLMRRMAPLATDQSPFARRPPASKTAHWVRPELVAEVSYTERTRDGVLRHPSFRGLREDREPGEIHRTPDSTDRGSNAMPAGKTSPQRARHRTQAKVAGVIITHPDRVMYPEQGLTKVDLARFYEHIQDWVLPGLSNRPLSLLRCPEGLETQCFFQKHPRNAVDDRVPRVSIQEEDGEDEYLYLRSVQDLVSLIQAGVMEIHPWGSRVDNVDKPDTLVFDLDPSPEVPWKQTVRVARRFHERLNRLGLLAFLRTTGGKGLHLVVPLRRGPDWDQVRVFARAVCEQQAADEPGLLTTNMSKSKRRGKIFLDYLRNGRGATAVASYTVRARQGAPVAVPLRWEELTPALASDRYNVENLSRRLASLRDDPWADFNGSRVALTAGMRQAVGVD